MEWRGPDNAQDARSSCVVVGKAAARVFSSAQVEATDETAAAAAACAR